MAPISRLPWFALLLVVALFLFAFSGPQVPGCLGPLNVTAVQCWAASGKRPMIGLGVPLLYVTLTATALVATGMPRPLRVAGLAAAAGAIVAGALYLAFRPTVMTGPTSTGAVISIDLPLDLAAVLAAAVAGAGVVLASLSLGLRLRPAAAWLATRASGPRAET